MLGMFQTLMAPRYPRRYIGRHRARRAFHGISPVAAVHRDVALLAVWQQTAN